MSMTLSLKICNNKTKWNNFVSSSLQSNIFCTTQFVDSLEVDYDLLIVELDKQILLGAIVLKKNNKPLKLPYSFSLYQGVLLNNIFTKMPIHQRAKYLFDTIDFLLAKMYKRYDLISFSLHYKLEDLRSFLWFHYNQSKLGKFKMYLRYTGLINVNSYSDFESYFKAIRKVRRYEYRLAIKNKLKVEASDDVDKLDYLYRLTFKRQGISRSKMVSKNLKKIIKTALAKNYGELLFCNNYKGEAIGATFYLFDKKCGYYLVGANHPNYRQTGSGTLLMIENIRRCFKKRLELIDVCGINSPNRGDFKTSFNAQPTPYFEVAWEKPTKRL